MSKLLRIGEEPNVEPEYIPRLTSDGMRGNPYWYSRNPFYQAGFGLPNCTCYAWGRFWENADINADFSNRPNLSTGNAQDWFGHTSDGYERGNVPALGAIACYSGGDFSGLGHVCVIEEIHDDYCVTSNSAYNGSYFYLVNIALNGTYPYGHYHFQGFIYNPYSGGGGWLFRKKPWLWKRELYKREESLLR